MHSELNMEELTNRVTEIEEYTPVINERLANNELAIEDLQERMEKQVAQPSG